MALNDWINANLLWITLVIAVIVLIYFVFTIIQTIRKKRRFTSQLNIILLILGLMFLIFLTYRASEIEGADWGQIILMIGLVAITAAYASSTEKQADASVKMAEMSSRPVIIQKAVVETETKLASFGSKDWLSYFEIFNAGNGTAIEVEISLLDKEKTPIHSHRETFLRAGESPIEFAPGELAHLEKSTFYIVCEYQSIFSRGSQPRWYQTWLPFETIESSQEGKIYVKPGELEFKEISEKEHIDAFRSRSKPK